MKQQGSFPMRPNGLPANAGPFLICLTSNRQLRDSAPHKISLEITEMPSGSWHFRFTWRFLTGDGQEHIENGAAILPRLTQSKFNDAPVHQACRSDTSATAYSAKGRPVKGVTYSLAVYHAYTPLAGGTVEDFIAGQQQLRTEVAKELDSLSNNLAGMRHRLADLRLKVVMTLDKPNGESK